MQKHGWSRDDLWDQVGRELGSPVIAAERNFLSYWGDVAQRLRGELATSDLARLVDAARRVWGAEGATEWEGQLESNAKPPLLPSGAALPKNDEEGARAAAASRVLAARASREHDVRRFRADVLGDSLLTFEEVEGWVVRQTHSDGAPSYWLSDAPVEGAAIANGADESGYTTVGPFRVPVPWLQQEHQPKLARRFLEYYAFARREPLKTAIAAGGVLEQLFHLAQSLADPAGRYRWGEAQAASFVLSGMVPLMRLAAPITLDVDVSASVREIAELFKMARQDAVGMRGRALGAKALHLAVFASERPEGESPGTRMRAWNEAYPEWGYTHAGHFTQESNASIRRLLREEEVADASQPRQPRRRGVRAEKPTESRGAGGE